MTEKDQSNETRRTFMKGAAATGVAATGITAFSGNAAGQSRAVQRVDAVVDATQLNLTEQETGTTEVSGLINVVVQNVDVDALNNVIVQLGGVNVNVQDVSILNNNDVDVQIIVNDVLNLIGNQIAVTLLGTTQQNQRFRARGTDTINQTQ